MFGRLYTYIMQKAVIKIGSNQYLVHEGLQFDVNFIKDGLPKIEVNPFLIFDDKKVEIGTPELSERKVVCEVVVASKLADKVRSIRYKAKKRVKTIKGHRQKLTTLKVIKIS